MEFEILTQIIKAVLKVDDSEVHEKASFVKDLGADSLDAYMIIAQIEERFNIEITAEMAKKVVTVGDLLKIIQTGKI